MCCVSAEHLITGCDVMCARKLEDRSTLDILFSKYKGQVGWHVAFVLVQAWRECWFRLLTVPHMLRCQERPLYNMICKKYAARNTTLAAETEMPAHSAVAEAAIGASTGTTPLLQS